MRERAKKLFAYLHAVRALKEEPIRDIRAQTDARWWPNELPHHPILQLGSVDGDDLWLKILPEKRPARPDLPQGLLVVGEQPSLDDPFAHPELSRGDWSDGLDESEVRRLTTQFDEWVSAEWSAWAADAKQIEALRAFHDQMYELRLRLQREESVVELVWGHGVFGWDAEGAKIFHPILVTPVRVEYVASNGAIEIRRDSDTALEIDCLGGLQIRGYDQLVLQRAGAEAEAIDPWDAVESALAYENFLRPLSADGYVDGEVARPPTDDLPVVASVSVLMVRRRRTMFQRFFESMERVLDDESRPVPPALAQTIADASNVALSADDSQDFDSEASERFMLPLPFNDEQVRVVEQLARNNGVTVQGPPGTGKTHTIANITSHLVAHGKRVLVTSQKEQPLAVLRDKIPEEIQSLCVGLLGGSGSALSQVGQSAQAIQGHAVGLDKASASRAIATLEATIDALSRDIARTQSELRQVATDDQQRFSVEGRDLTTTELAKWIAEKEAALSFVSDDLNGDPLPLDEMEFAELCGLSISLPPKDRSFDGESLPKPDSLPSAESLEELFRELQLAEQTLSEVAGHVDLAKVESLGEDEYSQLQRFVEEARAVALETEARTWLLSIQEEVKLDVALRAEWTQFVELVRESLSQQEANRARTLGHSIEFRGVDPSTKDFASKLGEIQQAISTSGKLSIWDRKSKKLLAELLLDGAPPKTDEELELVASAASIARQRTQLAAIWLAQLARISGPEFVATDPNFDVEMRREFGRLERLLRWLVASDEKRSELAKVTGIADASSSSELEHLESTLSSAGSVFSKHRANARIDDVKKLLVPEKGKATDAMRASLISALDSRDVLTWRADVEELGRLAAVQPAVKKFDALLSKVSIAAPLWAGHLRRSTDIEGDCGSFDRTRQAWQWRTADTWLKRINESDPDTMQAQLNELSSRKSQAIAELTTQAAWLRMAENLTAAQRQALTGWVQALSKVGKGTGKYASKWRAVAREHMDDAKDAVPVWIMPLYRVVESFDPSAIEPFDVVIVDESSQCDLFSLAVLGIAKKVIVVGDDKQISPQAVGVNQQAVHELIEQHIAEVPNAELFDVTSSLYDHAKRTFPGVIMLREHFRCVPEIIQFSNDLCYDGQMLPLREDTKRALDGPVKQVFVTDGYRDDGTKINRPELDALVNQVTECCSNPAYDGLTMGVISLLGFDQAQEIETALIRAIGESAYEERNIRCGDAYHFQGDERDIMFLSMVAAGERIGAMTKRADQQRVNVAASRAKDQMWLFHSAADSQFHEDDVRAKLIRYCADPNRVAKTFGDLADLCESQFEKDVLKALLAHGYRVTPQHRVGKFRLDFVVDGISGRVAIECDGDAYHGPDQWEDDRRRQEILERLGWRFIRIRGSEFYRDRESAVQRVVARLSDFGIDQTK